MADILRFPEIKDGQKIALYTQNHIYMGNMESKDAIPGYVGIWLSNATVIPIKSQCLPNEVITLGSVYVLFDHVVAFGPPPNLVSLE